MKKHLFLSTLLVSLLMVGCTSKPESGIIIAINSGGRGYFVDCNGNKLFGRKFEAVEKFSEGLAAVKKHNKWGVIDNRGNLVIPCKYNYVMPFSDGLAEVMCR